MKQVYIRDPVPEQIIEMSYINVIIDIDIELHIYEVRVICDPASQLMMDRKVD